MPDLRASINQDVVYRSATGKWVANYLTAGGAFKARVFETELEAERCMVRVAKRRRAAAEKEYRRTRSDPAASVADREAAESDYRLAASAEDEHAHRVRLMEFSDWPEGRKWLEWLERHGRVWPGLSPQEQERQREWWGEDLLMLMSELEVTE